MKKILVPIDFSPASKSGFEYAAQVSLLTGADLFVINIYPESGKDLPDDILTLMQLTEEKKRQSKLEQFTKIYPHEVESDHELKLNISYLVRSGAVEEEIVKAGLAEGIDLIIMGTKSKHNMWEYLFGSISSNLFKKAKFPVLIIPQGTIFHKPKKIGYGTEFYLDESPAHQYLNDFATEFKAEVEQVHINIFPKDFSDHKEEIIDATMGNTDDQEHNYVTMIRDTSVKRGLDLFIKTHKIDILSLYLPKREFPENIFHRSLSKRYALSTHIPLLIIKQEN